MRITQTGLRNDLSCLALMVMAATMFGGCGNDGPAITSRPQYIIFKNAPSLTPGDTATITAAATSGLPITYSSTTPDTCSVDRNSGLIAGLKEGTCVIAANQGGNYLFAPAPQATQNLVVSFKPGQSISFGPVPVLKLGGTATVTATATSGLPVTFSSTTPSVCTVDGATGLVTDLTAGTCIIAADQPGSPQFAPAPQVTQSITVENPNRTNQTITFTPASGLTVGSNAYLQATASSGLPVTYSSSTPLTCSVNSSSGLLTGIAAGTCLVAANQPGNESYNPAPQATQTITVTAAPLATVPGTPTGVSATAGNSSNTVLLSFTPPANGGSPITAYTAVSTPPGITATGSTSPLTITCPASCSGYAFAVSASNVIGSGTASAAADIITAYKVFEQFYEPDTQPRDSIFTGTFVLNSTKGTVSNLNGRLSESMTGSLVAYPNDNMTWLPLSNQLSSVNDGQGGVLVTVFLLPTTNTFTTNPLYGGSDGWSPGTGSGLHYGFPTAKTGISNPGNAYARIYVNIANPTAPLTQAQIDKLAYADCAPGGMMGATCMTGTTVAGYGTIGTMSGYPVSQTITRP